MGKEKTKVVVTKRRASLQELTSRNFITRDQIIAFGVGNKDELEFVEDTERVTNGEIQISIEENVKVGKSNFGKEPLKQASRIAKELELIGNDNIELFLAKADVFTKNDFPGIFVFEHRSGRFDSVYFVIAPRIN